MRRMSTKHSPSVLYTGGVTGNRQRNRRFRTFSKNQSLSDTAMDHLLNVLVPRDLMVAPDHVFNFVGDGYDGASHQVRDGSDIRYCNELVSYRRVVAPTPRRRDKPLPHWSVRSTDAAGTGQDECQSGEAPAPVPNAAQPRSSGHLGPPGRDTVHVASCT